MVEYGYLFGNYYLNLKKISIVECNGLVSDYFDLILLNSSLCKLIQYHHNYIIVDSGVSY